MTEAENKAILHQIRLGRVENGIVQKALKVLNNASEQLSEEIKKTGGIWTKKRYKEVRQYLKEVQKELTDNLDENIDAREFLEYELKAQVNLYKKYGHVNLVAPSFEQIYSVATFAPYTASSTFENFLNSFGDNFFNVWDSQIRQGFISGFTSAQIVRNVMGSAAKNAQVAKFGQIEQLKTSLERNTRTALQAYAENVREQLFNANKEVIKGYKWIATLDRRSCLVCANLDGKIESEIKDFGGTPPLHYNCRCTVLPVVKGQDDNEDERASAGGYVKASVTFEDWLAKQSNEVQLEVLGTYRYELYKNGESIKNFVADNRILTIKELQNKEL